MHIAICDDDKKALAEIKGCVEEFMKNKGAAYDLHLFCDGESLAKSDVRFDLAFIDIYMPGMNGLVAARHIQRKNENAIVFIVTDFNDYLDDAMEISVYRYLLKPIDKKRFMTCLSAAVKKYFLISAPVVLESEGSVIRLNVSDIVYLSIESRYITVHTAERDYATKKNMEWWKNNLNLDIFAQPHKSYLVNLNYVTDFNNNSVTMTHRNNTYTVHCSRRNYTNFKKSFYAFLRGTNVQGGGRRAVNCCFDIYFFVRAKLFECRTQNAELWGCAAVFIRFGFVWVDNSCPPSWFE